MVRFLKIAGCFLIFFCSLAYADNLPNPNITYKEEQIQKILDNWRKHSGIPGATVSIYTPSIRTPMTVNSGTTRYGSGQRVQDNTLYQAGSITKSFTSTIMLKLEADGRLNLDDPITLYLPQYPQWRNVTIRQLLNHTSGIYNYTEAGTFNRIRSHAPQAQFTPTQIVQIARNHGSYFYPGSSWKYSNTNYVLAGMIIERITGRPSYEVINEFLRSGNLVNSYYVPGMYSKNFMSRMAHGYSTSGSDATYDNMSWAYTAGAIVTTTKDLLAWWRGLFRGQILPKAQLNEMMSLICESSSHCVRGQPIPHFNEYTLGKGYGLAVIQSSFSEKIGTVWWHNGSTRGYKAIVMWFPKSDIYIALAINHDPGYLLKPELPIVRRILNVLLDNTNVVTLTHKTPRTHIRRRRKTRYV